MYREKGSILLKIFKVIVSIVFALGLVIFVIYSVKEERKEQLRLINESRLQEESHIQEEQKDNASYLLRINEIFITTSNKIEIEIYNPSNFDIDLSGFYFMTSQGRLYDFTDTDIIEKGEFKVINFESDIKEGIYEYFELVNDFDESIDILGIDDLLKEKSFGRINNGSSFAYLEETLGKSNGEASMGEMLTPVFSKQSGFYDDTFQLEILSEGDTDIFYTLDGSIPSKNSILYEGPITISDISYQANTISSRDDISTLNVPIPTANIDKSMIVRARAYDESNNQSEVITGAFFVGYKYKKGYDDIPVISLVLDPNNLFGFWDGIYVLGRAYEDTKLLDDETRINVVENANYKKDISVPAYIDVFDTLGLKRYQSKVDLSTYKDGWLDYPQKSLKIEGIDLSTNNEKSIVHQISNLENDALVFSNGRSDYYSKLREILNHRLLEGSSIFMFNIEPVTLFINGEYWGIYHVTSDITAKAISNELGVSTNDVGVMELNTIYNEEFEVYQRIPSYSSGSTNIVNLYEQLLTELSAIDMEADDAYDLISELIDIDSFLDYYSSMIIIGNSEFLRGKQYLMKDIKGDSKWQWILYPSENSMGLGNTSDFKINSLMRNDLLVDVFYRTLMKNKKVREMFVYRLEEHMNFTYNSVKVHNSIESFKNVYEDSLYKYFQRFLASNNENAFDMTTSEILEFFDNRIDYLMVYIQEAFKPESDIVKITVKNSLKNAGSVKVNDRLVEETMYGDDYEWTGYYFTKEKVELEAISNEGYIFTGWKNINGETIEGLNNIIIIDDLDSMKYYEAVFEEE